MAFEIPGFNYSLDAAGDLSAEQFTFMVADANGRADQAGAATAPYIGVLQNDPGALGEPANIQTFGVSKMVAGAAVAAGAQVMSDATGRAITATATNFSGGIALQAAANADEIIAVLVMPGGQLNV